MIRRSILIIRLCAAVSLLVFCGPERAHSRSSHRGRPPGGDPVLGERIAKGVAFDGRLWLRGTLTASNDASGGVISLGIKDNSREVHFEHDVLDIEKSAHDLWLLRRGEPKHHFVISAWRNGHFENLVEFQTAEKDEPIALLNSAGVPVVLSGQTIRIPTETGQMRVVQLTGKLRSGVQVIAASPENGENIYVGFNMGEWGGGIQQIDMRTGAVANTERRDTKALCDGPLNSDCDPVTGVIPDPQHRDCVLASVGLVHLFMSNGRVLRICDKRVTLVSELLVQNKDSFKQTEAFYGLASAVDGFWAITWRALYRFDTAGNVQENFPLPKMEAVSGIYLSRAIPGAIVLKTDVNWAVSTSGYTPLLVPLEH